MKVDCNYTLVLKAIEKLDNTEVLNRQETREILKVLQAVKGDYIPTEEEMLIQADNLKNLEKTKSDINTDRFNRYLAACAVYENKYL